VRRSDVVVVASYAVTFIMLGAWLMASTMGIVTMWEAFVLWMASIGAIITSIGLARARSAPRLAGLQVGVGGSLLVLGMVSYFVLGESLDVLKGFALMLIVCSSLILIIYLTRYRLEKE
jgi:hypothetical protein